MDVSTIIMWLGFFLAAYSVVGNDVIQTLGTFLTSNETRLKWWVMWLFVAIILIFCLVYGYYINDISRGKLAKFDAPEVFHWYYILPPLMLMVITRFGIPVSTTFMILTLFSLQNIPGDVGSMVSSVFDPSTKLGGMIVKSITGYILSFSVGILVYLGITKFAELHFQKNAIKSTELKIWAALQWGATGFLWYQWLIQDLANIYCYIGMGRDIGLGEFILSLVTFLALLAYIMYRKGGKVQEIVRVKENTADIRSATLIDFTYAIILLVLKDNIIGLWEGKIPMSTTWVFVGLLSGREIAINFVKHKKLNRKVIQMVFKDLGKVGFGLFVSVLLVFIIKLLTV